MNEGNVLVIGNSGVGKSTLINAVLGEDRAETGWGVAGTTGELKLYKAKAEEISFRVIDSVGFEPSLAKELRAINSVKKWLRDSTKKGNENNQINVIWFCVDGTAAKLFPRAVSALSRATALLPSVPVVVVITKSYAIPDRQKNIQMVKEAFANQKRFSEVIREIIPVVASTFVLNETAFAPPEGIAELIDTTNELMPEGIKASKEDVSSFILKRKRVLAHGTVGVATAGAVVVGAVPIPFADGLVLAPLEITEVNALARIYEIDKNEQSKLLFKAIIEMGTVSVAAKTAISGLKAIPGINLAASVINAIIAGSFAAALGEGSIYVFEQIYLGKKNVSDIEWVKKIMETKFSKQFIDTANSVLGKISDDTDKSSIAKTILGAFSGISDTSKGDKHDS